MVSKSGLGLRLLQWFIRGIQFCCAAIILALFSYFLAVQTDHHLVIHQWVRAVEGISGAAVLYTLLGLLLLCCVAGHPFTSSMAILLDILFAAAFIYIAAANGHTATDSCRAHVDTVFGSGDADRNVHDNDPDSFTALPSLRQACEMQTAVFAVAIIGIVFFILSALVEILLVRHRRNEKRFGPGPANGYTSGSGSKRGGLLGRFGRKRATVSDDPNALPVHAHPDEVRDSYATEQTRVGTSNGGDANVDIYGKYGESGFNGTAPSATPAPGTTENPYYTAPHTAAPVPAHTATAAPVAAAAPVVNPYRYDNVNSGITGGGQGTSVNDTAQYPAGNYKYDDGVYNSRV